MGKLSKVKTDSKKEIEGIWEDYEEGIRLKIARMGNPLYDEEIYRLSKPVLKRSREIPADELERISKQAVAKYILVDWENIEDDDGNEIPYSSEKALEYFNDHDLRGFYRDIILIANDRNRFRREFIEEAVKN